MKNKKSNPPYSYLTPKVKLIVSIILGILLLLSIGLTNLKGPFPFLILIFTIIFGVWFVFIHFFPNGKRCSNEIKEKIKDEIKKKTK